MIIEVLGAIGGFVIDNRSALMKGTGVILIGAGFVDGVKNGPIVKDALEYETKLNGGKDIGLVKKGKIAARSLWRPAGITALGVGLLAGGYHIQVKDLAKANARLAADAATTATAAKLVHDEYAAYRDKAGKLIGEEKSEEIKKEAVKETDKKRLAEVVVGAGSNWDPTTYPGYSLGHVLYFLPTTGHLFWAKGDESIIDAVKLINEEMIFGDGGFRGHKDNWPPGPSNDKPVALDRFLEHFALDTSKASGFFGFDRRKGKLYVDLSNTIKVHGVPVTVIDFEPEPAIWRNELDNGNSFETESDPTDI